MLKKFFSKKRSKGFSLAELLIVVAIMAILACIGVPNLFRLQKETRQTELDAKAEIIYNAVQNKLTKLNMGGLSNVYQTKANNVIGELSNTPNYTIALGQAVDKDPTNKVHYYTSEVLNDADIQKIMGDKTVSEDLLGNHWVVEYDAKNAIVYAVFYSESRANCAADYSDSNTYANVYDAKLRVSREMRLEDGANVGYYSSDSAAGVDAVVTVDPEIHIYNEEKLIAEISCVSPTGSSQYEPTFDITFTPVDASGNSFIDPTTNKEVSVTKTYAQGVGDTHAEWSQKYTSSGVQYTLAFKMDDLSNKTTRFASIFKNELDAYVGKDIKVTAHLSFPNPGAAGRARGGSDCTETTNSLFAYHGTVGSGATGITFANDTTATIDNIAYIGYGRHLQNLDKNTSGVVDSITHAVQYNSITFSETGTTGVDTSNMLNPFWYSTYSGKYFKPINNTKLKSYEALFDGAATANVPFKIIDIEINETDFNETDSGMKGVGLFAELADTEVKNVLLTDAKVLKSSTSPAAAGTIAGVVSGDAKLTNCQVRLTSSYTKDHHNLTNWPSVLINGTYAGGLVGEVYESTGSKLTIEKGFASTVIGTPGTTESTGGLVGKALGPVTITKSYADSYLGGKEAGGLVGYANERMVSIDTSYAAGFERYDVTTGAGAGLVVGKADSMENSYTVMYTSFDVGVTENNYYATDKGDDSSFSKLYYIKRSNPETLPSQGIEFDTSGDDTVANLLAYLDSGADGFSGNVSESTPYNLMISGLTQYEYPVISGVKHYGDWKASFKNGRLVYYEKYNNTTADKQYGFYGANIDALNNETDDSTGARIDSAVVAGDGFAIAYDHKPTEGTVSITVHAKTNITETINLASITPYETVSDGVRYYIYPFSKAIANAEIDSTCLTAGNGFYLKAEVEGRSYYFNPHFAKAIVTGTTATATLTAPVLDSESYIYVRTPRQLYMMSKYYDFYAEATKNSTYLQEKNIDYTLYDWTNYFNTTSESFDGTQMPIAGGTPDAKNAENDHPAFQATYDGDYRKITNVSFVTTDGLYVGFIGRNAGTIKNVVLASVYTPDTETTTADNYYIGRTNANENGEEVHMGILVGENETDGKISNCAVSGYFIAGDDGTIHVYQNSTTYIGGLVGTNNGVIEDCSADSPVLKLSSTYADVYAGGFAGDNAGTIDTCYAIGHIEVVYAKGGSLMLAGFAGENTGLIYDSYCTTALTASGSGASTYGFAPEGGTVTDCNYLNNGTYYFVDSMHAFNFDSEATDGDQLNFRELRSTQSMGTAKHSFDFNNTLLTQGEVYPFRAVVKNKAGDYVHYGDWVTEENMGIYGMFYWEHEEGGSNDGYHFTYLGIEKNGTLTQGTSLCTSHDDGGVITEYGYGYYELNQGSVTLDVDSSNVINGINQGNSSNHTFSYDLFKNDSETYKYNITASGELSKQLTTTIKKSDNTEELATFNFYAFNSRMKEDATDADNASENDNGNYLSMCGNTSYYGTWTLNYTVENSSDTEQQIFYVCPFFANAMQRVNYKSDKLLSASDGSKTNYNSAVGKSFNESSSGGNPFEIRSIEQLQFINWRTYSGYVDSKYYKYGTYTDSASYKENNDAGNATDFPYESYYSDDRMRYSQTHDIKNKNSGNTSRKFYPLGRSGRNFKEHYNGNSYVIKNLNISESTSCYVGLFGEAGGGSSFNNIILTADPGKGIIESTYIATQDREPVVGSLIGMVWVGDGDTGHAMSINNCSSSGYTVKYTGEVPLGCYRWISVGGLIGSMYCGEVTNCSASNNVVVATQSKIINPQQLGGLIGTSGTTQLYNQSVKPASKVTNCYTGGSITPQTKNPDNTLVTGAILCGGLVGNPKATDRSAYIIYYDGSFDINWTDQGEVYKETEISNCYSYCDVAQSSGQVSDMANGSKTWSKNFSGYYYIAPNLTTVNNVYYFNDDHTGTGVGTSLSYNQMADLKTKDGLLYRLGGTVISKDSDKGNVSDNSISARKYHSVTMVEGTANVSIPGKYSFAADSSYEGKDFPFPAIVTQKDLIFGTTNSPKYVYVHYGDWPVIGPMWQNGFETIDIFADMTDNTYAYKTVTLNMKGYAVVDTTNTKTGTRQLKKEDFVTNDDQKVVVTNVTPTTDEKGNIIYDASGHIQSYTVTLQAAKNLGSTKVALLNTLVYTKDKEYTNTSETYTGITSDVNVSVTADITLSADPSSMSIGRVGPSYAETVTLTAISGTGTTAKDYSTAKKAAWSIPGTKTTGGAAVAGAKIVADEQDTDANKNRWTLYREGNGYVLLGAKYTYNYHENLISDTTPIEIKQPVSVIYEQTNGTANLVGDNAKEAGDTITLPQKTICTGPHGTDMSFMGWKTQGDATLYDEGASYTIPEDSADELRFVPVWSKKSTITLKNEVTGQKPQTQYITALQGYGWDLVTDATTGGYTNPSNKIGYKFDGWITSATEGSVKVINVLADTKETGLKSLSFVGSTDYTDDDAKWKDNDATLYSAWTPISYTIEFNGNTSTEGSMEPMVGIRYDEQPNPTLTPNAYKKTGYSFLKWNTKADGTGDSYANCDAVNNLTDVDKATVTMFAQWTPHTYTIAFDGNGSTDDSSMKSMAASYDVETNLTSNIFTKTGYSFNGWKTVKAEGASDVVEASYTDGAAVKNLTAVNGKTVTMHAQWNPISYKIILNKNAGPNDETKEIAAQYDTPVELTRELTREFKRQGYSLDSWNTKSDGKGTTYELGTSVSNLATTEGAEVKLYAIWSGNNYSISFDANGGHGPSMADQKAKVGTTVKLDANTFTRDGFDFNGWNTKADGSGVSYDNGAFVSTFVGDVTLYAQWVKNTYTVTFDINGATSGTAPASITVRKGNSVTIPAGTGLSRGSYKFEGWNTAPTGLGTDYAVDATPTFTEDTTLHAKWTYTVTFDVNGGSGTAPSAITVPAGQTVTMPGRNDLSNGSYKFEGWNTATTGLGTDYAVGATPTFTEDTTLYAKWTYTVTFDVNGGSGTAPSAITVPAGQPVTMPEGTGLSNGNYTFAGWNTATTGLGTDYAVGATPIFTEDITLYAKWSSAYTIEYYNDRNASTTTRIQTALVGDRITLLANVFSNGNKKFVGWSKYKNSTNISYYDRQSLTSETLGASAGSVIKLYAIWSNNYRTIHYSKNDNNAQGTMNDQFANKNTNIVLSANAFTNDGYVFNGWKNDSGTSYADGATMYVGNGNNVINLYAQWARAYTITFDTNGGSGTAPDARTVIGSQSVTMPAGTGLSKTNYRFAGWNTNADGTGTTYEVGATATFTEDKTLYAKWVGRYTIEFDKNSEDATGATMADQMADVDGSVTLSKNSFTRSGYRFDGWSTTPTGSKEYTDEETLATGISGATAGSTKTLYAQWVATYRIQFNKNYSNASGNMSDVTADVGASITLPENAFTRSDGYVFIGWSTTPTGSKEYTDEETLATGISGATAGSTQTLYAQWAGTFTIHFDKNLNNTGLYQVKGSMDDKTYVLGASDNLPSNQYTCVGWISGITYKTFKCWNTKSDGTGIDYANGADTSGFTGNTTLYAQWN